LSYDQFGGLIISLFLIQGIT